jgi:hypothetical protein
LRRILHPFRRIPIGGPRNRFEELPVWQLAVDLAVRTYEFTEAPEFKGRYSLKDQIEREEFLQKLERVRRGERFAEAA